jgi:hypothetical protein
VALAEAIPSHGNTSRTRAHDDARSIRKRGGQCNLDIGGHEDVCGDGFVPKRGAQLVALRLATSACRTHHQNIAGQPPSLG